MLCQQGRHRRAVMGARADLQLGSAWLGRLLPRQLPGSVRCSELPTWFKPTVHLVLRSPQGAAHCFRREW